MLEPALNLAGQHINLRYAINLIPEKLHADRRIAIVCREYLKHIPADPERAAMKIHLISRVLNIDQRTDDLVPVLLHARAQRYHHAKVILRAAQTIDTGNRCHNDHISPLHKRSRGRQAQFIYLLIDCRVFCDIGIRLRHIRLRLIIIIV